MMNLLKLLLINNYHIENKIYFHLNRKTNNKISQIFNHQFKK